MHRQSELIPIRAAIRKPVNELSERQNFHSGPAPIMNSACSEGEGLIEQKVGIPVRLTRTEHRSDPGFHLKPVLDRREFDSGCRTKAQSFGKLSFTHASKLKDQGWLASGRTRDRSRPG